MEVTAARKLSLITGNNSVLFLVTRCTEEVISLLMHTATNRSEHDGILATRLCTHKDDVELTNERRLRQLSGEFCAESCWLQGWALSRDTVVIRGGDVLSQPELYMLELSCQGNFFPFLNIPYFFSVSWLLSVRCGGYCIHIPAFSLYRISESPCIKPDTVWVKAYFIPGPSGPRIPP